MRWTASPAAELDPRIAAGTAAGTERQEVDPWSSSSPAEPVRTAVGTAAGTGNAACTTGRRRSQGIEEVGLLLL